jgi:hypothetical protein
MVSFSKIALMRNVIEVQNRNFLASLGNYIIYCKRLLLLI